MVGVWSVIGEPFILHRVFHRVFPRWADEAPDRAPGWLRRVHRVLLALSLITIVGALAGSHGRLIFW